MPDPHLAVRQWRRVLAPGGRVVMSVPADGGLPAMRHLIEAAACAAADLRTQRRPWLSCSKIEHFAQRCDLRLEALDDATFDESPTPDADGTLDHMTAQGLGEPLRTAPLPYAHMSATPTECATRTPLPAATMLTACLARLSVT